MQTQNCIPSVAKSVCMGLEQNCIPSGAKSVCMGLEQKIIVHADLICLLVSTLFNIFI